MTALTQLRNHWKHVFDDVPLRAIFALFAITRAALFLVVGYTRAAIEPDVTLFDGIRGHLCRFDCNWFLSIAQNGYSMLDYPTQPAATNLAFFPLFPLVLRAGAATGLNPVYVGALVCNVLFFVALIYVYRYLRLIGATKNMALSTVALLCLLPQSIAFSVPYSESLFLLLLAMAMFYLRRQQFLLAGIAAALLAAERANGVFFALFTCVWIWRRFGWDSVLRPWRVSETYLPVVLAPCGVFLYWGFCFALTGDAFAQHSTELHGWGWYFGSPWHGIVLELRQSNYSALSVLVSLGVFVLSLRLIALGLLEDAVFCLACIVLIWCSQHAGSIFRYWLPLFPAWYVLARWIDGRPLATALVFSVLSIANGALTCAWVLQNNFGT